MVRLRGCISAEVLILWNPFFVAPADVSEPPGLLCAGLDNPALMQYWFQLVQKKNVLVRYEFKLMIL